ncbi:class I SAM-dependent methyltransferase [Lampropedia puyangensis]|uniref:Class I SAM-dependent methyltransferase n=1 Tax=Lampropedia puyangensis TaxID=1330072 RepID=A0A4V4GSG2_9BURK|nr:class I SAM-dependent methyltransferase [Lampropedia puyangensis]THU05396.1 class I SAM-dependent methyltransferase [Lampropedia puyangensis]
MTANTSATERLTQAQQLLSQSDFSAAAPLLLQARQEPSTRLAAHHLIEKHQLEGSFQEMMGLNCSISQQDDIFHFFAGHPTSINPLRDYFADGWRTLSELMLLLEKVNKPLSQTKSFLEFASGHGRFTRHLVKAIGEDALTVSDVVEDAVHFSTQTFGVKGFVSSTEPEQVTWPSQYEVVFVLSLFTHLPLKSWSRWLNHLYQSVQPGGVLVFTTHGIQAQQRQRVEMDETGLRFFPSSESNAIEAQEYGTTFTSDAFVRSQIAQTIGIDQLRLYAPASFWNYQDAYIIGKLVST